MAGHRCTSQRAMGTLLRYSVCWQLCLRLRKSGALLAVCPWIWRSWGGTATRPAACWLQAPQRKCWPRWLVMAGLHCLT